MATNKGAAMAAGVPKPEAPSINDPKSHAMIITCTRLSGLMLLKPCRITAMAPECLSVFKSKIAPKIIHKTAMVISKPWMVDAKILLNVTSQIKYATAVVAK